ncbi:hypothetical protein JIN85_19555 [Luteolibacter pohnpeiensis]|uniref:Uncharacterized protein n=1 Tax=Luteolibacter pohnpeiensis TaxID=454153 RepID=A0A934SEF8_9BACT|nr:hypothetical protein [Luteolibacter pohnpeiensis]MBK1884622.1 hypothetical protein [Luteolibacter pohnpeiensis]
MKRLFVIPFLISLLLLNVSRAERSIIEVYQPTSLLGTESEGNPLGTGEWMAATIVSRPVIIGGAFPESPVHAVTLPHKIAGAPDGFPEESNLIVIVGGDVRAEWGQTEDQIIADFSKAKLPENLGVTLIQVMKMTALCLDKTLGTQHEKPIKIKWLAPAGISLADAGLPTEIKKNREQGAASNGDKPAN